MVTPDKLGELATQAGTGDRAATEALVRQMAPRLLGVARRILGARDPDVEDAAQDSLLAVMKAVRGFRGESSFNHYATRIAVRDVRRTDSRLMLQFMKSLQTSDAQTVEAVDNFA